MMARRFRLVTVPQAPPPRQSCLPVRCGRLAMRYGCFVRAVRCAYALCVLSVPSSVHRGCQAHASCGGTSFCATSFALRSKPARVCVRVHGCESHGNNVQHLSLSSVAANETTPAAAAVTPTTTVCLRSCTMLQLAAHANTLAAAFAMRPPDGSFAYVHTCS